MISLQEATSNLRLRIPKHVLDIHKAFKREGKKLYIVGGAVRDAILGKRPKDFDLATDAKPEEVLKIADKYGFNSNEVGKAFGVVVVNGEEIATFRKDIGKGRRPDAVDYTDIEGDVKRRDLTINALFYDIEREEIVDLVGGVKDLKDKNIRTVGKAEQRFDEDPLRKLRVLRFAGRIGGKIESSTREALEGNPDISGVSPERIRDEFVKAIQTSKSTKWYLKTADDIKILQQIFPRMNYSRDFIDENNYKLLISWMFRKKKAQDVYSYLKKLKYSHEESYDIKFLIHLTDFKPEYVFRLKKLQENTSLSDKEILQWGKMVGQDLKKFIRFNLSVSGHDVMNMGFKGKEIGKQIEKMEKEKFLNENKVKGGLADGMSVNDIAKHHGVPVEKIVKQLKMGIKVEMEHVNDAKASAEIALDHLYEDPDYYTKLKTIEPQHEASYAGNLGFEEMMKFYDEASSKQVKQLEKLIERGRESLAWKLVQKVTGTNLKGKEFENFVNEYPFMDKRHKNNSDDWGSLRDDDEMDLQEGKVQDIVQVLKDADLSSYISTFKKKMRHYNFNPKKAIKATIRREKDLEKLKYALKGKKWDGNYWDWFGESVNEIAMGYPGKEDIEELEKELKRLRKKFNTEKKERNYGSSYANSHLNEASIANTLSGGNNSARWTAPGQSRKLKIPQLSGYHQVVFPEADELDISNEEFGWEQVSNSKKYNNKRVAVRNDNGELVFEGMVGDLKKMLKETKKKKFNLKEAPFPVTQGYEFIPTKSFKKIKKGIKYIVDDIKGSPGNFTILIKEKNGGSVFRVKARSLEEFYSKIMTVREIMEIKKQYYDNEHLKLEVYLEDTEYSGVLENRFLKKGMMTFFSQENRLLNESEITTETKYIDNDKELFSEMVIQQTFSIIAESGAMPGVVPVPSSKADRIVKDFGKEVLKRLRVVKMDSIVGLGSTRQILQKLPNAKKVSGDLDLLAIAEKDDRRAAKDIADYCEKQGWDTQIAFGNIVSVAYPYKGKKYQVDLMIAKPSEEDEIYDYMRKFKYFSDEAPNQSTDFTLKGAHRSELAKTIVKAVGLSASNTGFKQFIWNDKFKNMDELVKKLKSKAGRYRSKEKKEQTLQMAELLDNRVKTLDKLQKAMTGGDELLSSRYPSSLFKKLPIAYGILIDLLFSKEATAERWEKVLDNKFNITGAIEKMNKFEDVMDLVEKLLKKRLVTPRSVVGVFKEMKNNFDTGKAAAKWNRALEQHIEDKFPFLRGRW